MNKLSYRVKPPEKKHPLNGAIPSIGMGDENFGSTESGGRTSTTLPGLPDTHEIPDEKMTISDAVKTIRHLSDTADSLDEDGLESEADFVDYLIQKFAAAIGRNISEEERFVEYIYKIYSSDIPGSVDKIKVASKTYSNLILRDVASGLSKEEAKAKSFGVMVEGGQRD